MLTRQRHHAILTLLNRRGAVTASELAEEFGVSDVTIRRDLVALHGSGLLHRVHGGAVRAGATAAALARHDRQGGTRQAIARLAAATVRPDTTIALSAGATATALAALVAAVGGLTVITNSLPAATAASRTAAPPDLLLLGGQASRRGAQVGSLARAAAESVHIETLYLDAYGMHPTAGFTTADLLEADINQVLVGSARRLVVLADHTAWGRAGIRTVARLHQAELVISDTGLPAQARTAVAATGGQLLLADPSPIP
ncbi:DeoR/GlpR family DNA-binding transcription regulator [Rugosimonospora africana]|uniref:DeoR family transcriptional regulator n=1 Tax=Rugosimonospora africana TaxID=556532 RepID=A0A8J3VUW7_9ACTN|nr:DeoR/GlpR family DNA-binding transcription regulator [Rugosimonospora africana]GIH19299.1 DeoR family transcriptional regulator [Rugosimonospora africana]